MPLQQMNFEQGEDISSAQAEEIKKRELTSPICNSSYWNKFLVSHSFFCQAKMSHIDLTVGFCSSSAGTLIQRVFLANKHWTDTKKH